MSSTKVTEPVSTLEFALKALSVRGLKPSPVYKMGLTGMEFVEIHVYSTKLMMQPTVTFIREYIGDDFKVTGFTNTENIIITLK